MKLMYVPGAGGGGGRVDLFIEIKRNASEGILGN